MKDSEHALKYARIRKPDNDFVRTERQRNVLSSVLKNAKEMSFREISALTSEVLPHMTTDLTNLQIMSILFQCFRIKDDAEVTSYRVPADNAYYLDMIRDMSVVVPDLPLIREQLEDYLPLNDK